MQRGYVTYELVKFRGTKTTVLFLGRGGNLDYSKSGQLRH